MTLPTHSHDERFQDGSDRLRFGVYQQASGRAASGPPITLPDEAAEIARDQVPDEVLSPRTSVDGAYGITSWLEGGERESKVPDGVTALTVDEMRQHIAENPDTWQPEATP